MPRLVYLCCFLAVTAFGQTEFRSPDVAPDGRVTLRLHAPGAESVSLRGGVAPEPIPMTRGDNGVWSVTIGPLPPDIYSYHFNVDGARMTDPRSRHTKNWLFLDSAFEVVGEPAPPHALRDVPQGTIHRHTYKSAARQGGFTAFYVYTPPGYDPRGDTRYPIVFLLHGFGDDERAWHEFGRANVIADNLIADGEATPAIVIMPHGHPQPIPFGSRVEWDSYGPANHARMERQVLEEILPQVEQAYLTKSGREHRAIVGLSMGGGHALEIGSHNLDTFSWVGGFSSGGATRNFDRHFAPLLKSRNDPSTHLNLLWIGCGEDDFLIGPNRALAAWLAENDVPHTYVETAGNHSWPIWRDYWARFFPLLFQ